MCRHVIGLAKACDASSIGAGSSRFVGVGLIGSVEGQGTGMLCGVDYGRTRCDTSSGKQWADSLGRYALGGLVQERRVVGDRSGEIRRVETCWGVVS